MPRLSLPQLVPFLFLFFSCNNGRKNSIPLEVSHLCQLSAQRAPDKLKKNVVRETHVYPVEQHAGVSNLMIAWQIITTHWNNYAAHWLYMMRSRKIFYRDLLENLVRDHLETKCIYTKKSVFCFCYILLVQTNNLLIIQVKY